MSEREPDWRPGPGYEVGDTVTMANGEVRRVTRIASSTARDVIRAAVQGVLWHVSNYPEPAQIRMLGQDIMPLTDKVTDAVMGTLAAHDAEVKAQALEEAAERFATGEWNDAFLQGDVNDDVSAVQATESWFKARAAEYRNGADHE